MQSSHGIAEFQLKKENSSIWEWPSAFVSPMGSAEEEDGGGGVMIMSVCLGIVLAIFIILTITGNAMVLHAVRTDRKLQTVSHVIGHEVWHSRRCNVFSVSFFE